MSVSGAWLYLYSLIRSLVKKLLGWTNSLNFSKFLRVKTNWGKGRKTPIPLVFTLVGKGPPGGHTLFGGVYAVVLTFEGTKGLGKWFDWRFLGASTTLFSSGEIKSGVFWKGPFQRGVKEFVQTSVVQTFFGRGPLRV